MKKYSIVCFIILFVICINTHAQICDTIHVKAGKLESQLAYSQKNKCIILYGEMDYIDFDFLKGVSLMSIDFTGINIVRKVVDGGYNCTYLCDDYATEATIHIEDDSNSCYTFTENVIPILALVNNTAIESIKLPKSTKEIHNQAFMGCLNLKSIVIDYKLEYIGREIFKNCEHLEEIHLQVRDPSKINLESSAFNGVSLEKCTLFVPQGCLVIYSNNSTWNVFKTIIEEKN